MTQPFVVNSGASVMIGAPAKPIAPEATEAIAKAVESVPDVAEAHLPLIFISGVTEQPAQSLVLVLARGADPARVMEEFGPLLGRVLPSGVHVDVWPIASSHELLPAIREAGCQVFRREASRPWWRIWG